MDYRKDFLTRAIDLAEISIGDGEGPFGAVLTDSNQNLISEARNSANSDGVVFHAEINAVLGVEKPQVHFPGGFAYCSCEPCPMCFFAMYGLGITNFVFGATIRDAIQYGSGDLDLPIRKLAHILELDVEVSNDLRDRAVEVFENHRQKFGHI